MRHLTLGAAFCQPLLGPALDLQNRGVAFIARGSKTITLYPAQSRIATRAGSHTKQPPAAISPVWLSGRQSR